MANKKILTVGFSVLLLGGASIAKAADGTQCDSKVSYVTICANGDAKCKVTHQVNGQSYTVYRSDSYCDKEEGKDGEKVTPKTKEEAKAMIEADLAYLKASPGAAYVDDCDPGCIPGQVHIGEIVDEGDNGCYHFSVIRPCSGSDDVVSALITSGFDFGSVCAAHMPGGPKGLTQGGAGFESNLNGLNEPHPMMQGMPQQPAMPVAPMPQKQPSDVGGEF